MDKRENMGPGFLSVVIPVFNEVGSIGEVLAELVEVLENNYANFEVLVIDDGSVDGTGEVLRSISSISPWLVLLRSQKNLGQTAALSAGFEKSRGAVVVSMDGDGQNDPRDIPLLVNALHANDVDCVSGWRKSRVGDKGLRIWFSAVANRMLKSASRVSVSDSGCTLKAYRGESIRAVRLYGEMHRIIPFQISSIGGVTIEKEVNHRPRLAGVSKYSLSRTFRVFQDVLVCYFMARFFLRPMHFLGTIGTTVALAGLLTLGLAFGLKLSGILDFVESPLLLIGLMLIVAGFLVTGTGLIAELILRTTGRSANQAFSLGYRTLEAPGPMQKGGAPSAPNAGNAVEER